MFQNNQIQKQQKNKRKKKGKKLIKIQMTNLIQ